MNENKGEIAMNKNKKKKRGKKVMAIFFSVIGVIIAINLISLFINQVFFSKELDGIDPYGELVEINGRKMHVYSMGHGETTIVLLPGFGVPLPSADFGPLMRELSKEYTVVCIEYFGVGFSDQTNVPRTNENYTEEIRLSLSSAGFAAPYVLMPHSGSSIFSEYYAAKYPDEVSAIILLDPTPSADIVNPDIPKFVGTLGKVQQAIGLSRLFNPVIVSSVLGINEKSGYTKEEIEDYTKFMNHCINDTSNEQTCRFNDNTREVMNMDFPNEIPVLRILSSETEKKLKDDILKNHLDKLGINAKSITLEGNHFIYHMAVTEIAEATISLLSQLQ